jgi:hypothetical protein
MLWHNDAQGNYYVGGMFSNQITVGACVAKVGGEGISFLLAKLVHACSFRRTRE